MAENPIAHATIAAAGEPAALVELLKAGIADAKDYALWSLSLSISAESQPIVADAGGIPPIIGQLADGRTEIAQQVSTKC